MSTESAPRSPPLDGSIYVLPGFVDFHAEYAPNNPWVVFPSREDPSTPASISYQEVAEATHRIAHVLRPGRVGPEQEIVAVLLHCDSIMYNATLVGMFRAGIVPFPMSPKNSVEAICHLLKTTNCHCILSQLSLTTLTSSVKSALEKAGYACQVKESPPLREVFPSLSYQEEEASTAFVPYPERDVRRGLDDLAMYLHSSGSTGLPKSIAFTEKVLLSWADCSLVRMSCKFGLRWAVQALPPFHSTGIFGHVLMPLVSGLPVAHFTPQAPSPPVLPNPRNMIEECKILNCNGLGSVPVFIEMWCRSPEDVEYLASLECLLFAGGPLATPAGDMLISKGVNIAMIYGSTEIGIVNKVMDLDFSDNPDPSSKRPEDWAWMQLDDNVHPRWMDLGDGTFELQVLASESHAMTVENLSDVRGYATGDIFEPHPECKGLWRIVGRLDDVIVLRTGEKVVPLPQEHFLSSAPMVSGAVMFGRGQSQPGVLIELTANHAIDPIDEKAVIEMRNRLWPHVQDANQSAPVFARLFKETILITDPSRPFPRAAKGTIVRKLAIKAYEAEISNLYAQLEESNDTHGVPAPEAWNLREIEAWLVSLAATVNEDKTPSLSADLFEQGFDSLSATFLRNRIIAVLRSSEDKAVRAANQKIGQDFIFRNPTLAQLSLAIVALIHPESDEIDPSTIQKSIQAMILKYSADLPQFKAYQAPSSGSVVLVTGSTGALGSHVVSMLLSDISVSEVITLHRGGDVHQRQKIAFQSRGLPVENLSHSKWTSLSGDTTKDGMGLTNEELGTLRSRVTHIVHCAWRVDFNLSLSSFESYVAGTRTLIDFSASCRYPVRLVFTSSVSAVYNWDPRKGEIPDEIIDDLSVAALSGYGASKFVIEHVLATASRQGMSVVSARIGQICGSTTSGDWNVNEWFPALVKTSLSLGRLPDLNGMVSWIPLDIASHCIVDALLSDSFTGEIFNVLHPRRTELREIYTALVEGTGNRMQIVPLSAWVKEIEGIAANAVPDDIKAYPVIKLLTFWRGILQINETAASSDQFAAEAPGFPLLEVSKAQKISASLRDADPLGEKDVALWLKYWERAGFISLLK
ncbi:putative NRPS-like protein biosynthetic cluster [Steccherinum ochraceum]|uniref:Putative NRPS-like protein biosynthetic cluster n=1 Tax=Steccherinum ochraceum TaxID=92696 RepID=A0A4R0R8T6_9APHY|nr:putative NRPS-like protein biosynthetic cluster [Steccherinum ochraceum]